MDLRPAALRTASGGQVRTRPRLPPFATAFVRAVYMRHNESRTVRRALERTFRLVPNEALVLDIGSGHSEVRPGVINLDIVEGEHVNLLGDAHCLPITDGAIDCVVSQEVFEHLPAPDRAMAEVARVLAAGGVLYLQVPFIIGSHSLPYDYFRFTRAGLCAMAERVGLTVLESGPSAGAGTSLYRVAVEFVAALTCGFGLRKAYPVVKGIAALLLSPLRWFDVVTPKSEDVNRIHGGYYVIARKPQM